MNANPKPDAASRGNRLAKGRKFSAGELHLMVLMLLNDRSRHGYDLIKEVSVLSKGFYTPSPGVLYPVLARAVALGHTTVEITGKRPVAEAIITSGGIKVSEIDPKTMESKLIPGLYFAGEIIDCDAYTGGFNLQIAWTTAHAAAMHIIKGAE